jgi:uncharacterized protein
MPSIDKPCIRKCCLNEEDICMGCFRSFDDMLKWNKASINEKTQMLKESQERKKEHASKYASKYT